MKSIMHEASSIGKAIEQGWEKAGKPKEFSVKILEEAQKNFIGLTKRSAKIALLFDEKYTKHETVKAPTKNAPKHAQMRKEAPKEHKESVQHKQAPVKPAHQAQEKPAKQVPQSAETPKRQQKQFAPLWNDEMVAVAREWVDGTLKTMDIAHGGFTVQPQNFHLRIVFKKPVIADANKEKQLFASFSTLILETLKGKFRLGLRGHKIVLTHEQ